MILVSYDWTILSGEKRLVQMFEWITELRQANRQEKDSRYSRLPRLSSVLRCCDDNRTIGGDIGCGGCCWDRLTEFRSSVNIGSLFFTGLLSDCRKKVFGKSSSKLSLSSKPCQMVERVEL